MTLATRAVEKIAASTAMKIGVERTQTRLLKMIAPRNMARVQGQMALIGLFQHQITLLGRRLVRYFPSCCGIVQRKNLWLR